MSQYFFPALLLFLFSLFLLLVLLQSDLKVITAGKGYLYYREHLPVLGQKGRGRHSSSTKFRVGDRVKVAVDMENVKRLQTGHGGWSNGMTEVSAPLVWAKLKCEVCGDKVKVK